MSIEEIKERIIELRKIRLEDIKCSERALEDLRANLYLLGFSVCWSDAQRDYVLFVRH